MEQLSFNHQSFLVRIAEVIKPTLNGLFKSYSVSVTSQIFPSSIEILGHSKSIFTTDCESAKRISIVNRIGQCYWIYPDTNNRYWPEEMWTEDFLRNILFPAILFNFKSILSPQIISSYGTNVNATLEKEFHPEIYLEKETVSLAKKEDELVRIKLHKLQREEERLNRVNELEKTKFSNNDVNRRIGMLHDRAKKTKAIWIPVSEHCQKAGYNGCSNIDMLTVCFCCKSSLRTRSDLFCAHTMMEYAKGNYNYSDTGSWILNENGPCTGIFHTAICDDCHDKIVLVDNGKIVLDINNKNIFAY